MMLVNEVFFSEEGNEVAIRVTHNNTLKTVRMNREGYDAAFPAGLYEGARAIVQTDAEGNIISMAPIRWFPVQQDLKKLPKKEAERYDYQP